jgi:hypothetical protein
VVTIYDLLLASILGICGSDASVAYPIPFRRSVSLTDLSNYVFIYIAGEMIPTIPPEFLTYLIKRCKGKVLI